MRARFLNAYVLHHATAFASGSLRLGVPHQRRQTAARRAMDAAVALVPRHPTPAQAIVRTVTKAFAVSPPPEASRSDDFESISTHGSKHREWRTAARAAVAQQRATAQQSSHAESSDSAFCLAVAIMSRRSIGHRPIDVESH